MYVVRVTCGQMDCVGGGVWVAVEDRYVLCFICFMYVVFFIAN